MFLIPAITMRSFSEEWQSGTIELLVTKPISDFSIVISKFLFDGGTDQDAVWAAATGSHLRWSGGHASLTHHDTESRGRPATEVERHRLRQRMAERWYVRGSIESRRESMALPEAMNTPVTESDVEKVAIAWLEIVG